MISRAAQEAGVLVLSLAAFLAANTQALALDKRASGALSHYIIGIVHDDLGDLDKAIQEYKQALKADKENPVIRLSLAESLIKSNQIPQAIEELNFLIRLNPEAVEPHAILALLYSSQNKLVEAAAEYEIALENAAILNPKNVDIYKSLAAIYLEQKKFKEAESAYKLVLVLSPDDAKAHFYLANIYNELKNSELAKKELKRALELKPDYHEVLNFLGYLYVEEGKNLEEARVLITKALELDPDNGAYIDSLGWLYFKQGKLKEAIKELEKASTLTEDPVIYDHLGDAYLKINDAAGARLNWEKSLKLDQDQEAVKKKIERLGK